uniref:Uncharacterized protein n=1 Tax=Pongo abelii TaxID=9601 RepID=A0A8I5TTL1_PONAB
MSWVLTLKDARVRVESRHAGSNRPHPSPELAGAGVHTRVPAVGCRQRSGHLHVRLMQRLLERPCQERLGEKYQLELPPLHERALKPEGSKNCLQRGQGLRAVRADAALRAGPRGPGRPGPHGQDDHEPLTARPVALACQTVYPESTLCVGRGGWRCRKSWRRRKSWQRRKFWRRGVGPRGQLGSATPRTAAICGYPGGLTRWPRRRNRRRRRPRRSARPRCRRSARCPGRRGRENPRVLDTGFEGRARPRGWAPWQLPGPPGRVYFHAVSLGCSQEGPGGATSIRLTPATLAISTPRGHVA